MSNQCPGSPSVRVFCLYSSGASSRRYALPVPFWAPAEKLARSA